VHAQGAPGMMSATHEQAAAKLCSLGEAVDPYDCVLPVLTVLGQPKKMVEVSDLLRLHVYIGRGNLLEREIDPQDQSRQPEPANGGLKIIKLGEPKIMSLKPVNRIEFFLISQVLGCGALAIKDFTQ
jgi:hypothetical protein